jgi:aminopeptidase N
MVIQATYEILGEDGFETLVDRLVTDFRYGNISTQQYVDLVAEVSGFTGADLEELLEFYDQWLYGEEKPTMLPEDVGPPEHTAGLR